MQFNLSVPKKTVQGLVIALMVLASSGDALKAQDRSENEHATMTISSWLKAGSFDVKMPAFSDQKSVKGDTFGESDLLKFSFAEVDALDPQEKNELTWKGNKLAWEKVVAAKNSFVYPDSKPQKDSHQMAYVAAYLQADRWMEAELEVTSPQLLEIYINGVLHDSKAAADKPEVDQTGSTKKTLKLERGKHLLLIKTLKPAGDENDWMVKATLSFPKKFEKSLQASLTPGTIKNIHQLLEGEFVNSSSVSPDGQMALHVAPPEGKTERWAEIRNLVDGGVIHTFRHADISSVSWVPEGRALSYRTSKDGKSTLWLFDLNDMSLKQLLSDAEDLGSYRWAPDGAFLIYLEGMPDRWPWWRSRSFLYRLDVQSGVSERLTYGHLSSDLHDIHPDGNKILFSQNLPDFAERPYSKQVLMEMDLETFKVDTIWENNVSGSCQYSPNGQYLLVTASATMFGNVGVNISDDAVPNESDTQAYIYSLGAGDVDPVTFAFNPSVIMAEWSQYDENKIYFVTTDRTFRNIYVYDMNTRYFDKIETGLDVVDGFSLARYQPVALCTGSGVSSPPDVRKVDLATGDIEVIANPREEQFRHVAFGKTEEWNFTSDAGVEIEGRIYYPPDFDESKKYPLIVYYYAGTSPTDRSFGGRYPKNMFAAQGFVVYNLQPSGATGYGQDFSAAHVNNWGITVADEIIQGTERFVEDHSFVDAEKIGCIGASYGGFMTMLLLSRTDIFAAGISHAGISNIASYWGEGICFGQQLPLEQSRTLYRTKRTLQRRQDPHPVVVAAWRR